MTIKQAISCARKLAYNKRNQLHWSQETVAKKAGVSVKVVRRLENGEEVKFSSACAIFLALGFFGESTEVNSDILSEIKAKLDDLSDLVNRL